MIVYFFIILILELYLKYDIYNIIIENKRGIKYEKKKYKRYKYE